MAATAGLLLLLLLLGISYGSESFCDGRQDGVQCSGIWGGTVFVQLMNNASETPRFEWNKAAMLIIRWRNNKVMTNTIESRSEFIANNGTFRIDNLRNKDSGEYILNLFDSKGMAAGMRTLQLSIKGQASLRIGAIAALIFFFVYLFVCVTITCVQKKRQKSKDGEIHADLTYSEVRVMQNQAMKPINQNKEEEVEYSQIKTVG